MGVLAAKVVDVGQLLQVIEAALIAGVGVAAAFSLVIYGSTRADDYRRQARPIVAGVHLALAALALAAVVAAITFGVITMLKK